MAAIMSVQADTWMLIIINVTCRDPDLWPAAIDAADDGLLYSRVILRSFLLAGRG